MKPVQFARRRIVALLLLLAVLAAAGAYQVTRLPSAIFPSVTFPLIKVIADVGEEPAARMMPTVTRPLEEAILRVPGIQLVRSTTSRGSTEIGAEFAWGTDMEVARQRVQAQTQRVGPDLPPDTRIDVEWMNPSIFPIQGYALTSRTRSQAELWDLAEYTLKPALIRIPGVSQVQIQGGRQREFQIHLNRQALKGRQLAAQDVVDAVQRQNDVLSAGLTERNHELYLALVNGRAHTLEELSRIAVPVPNGPPATLGELGRVSVGDAVTYVTTTANGDSAVLVNIIRQPSANTVAIAKGVRQLFRDQPNLLPGDVRWTNFYDQAAYVSNSVAGARDAILIGVALAALVLFVFLRKWRLTLIAVIAIPLTVAIVGLFLGVLGQTVNLMTLAGVAAALGLIADDAIVMIENIDRHEHERGAERDGDEDGDPDPAVSGAGELSPALIGSSLSTIVILLPFALLPGVAGAFFKPLALTMALALMVSFAIAFFAVPAALSRFGFAKRDPENGRQGVSRGERLRAWWMGHGGARLASGWEWVAGHFRSAYRRTTEGFVAHGLLSVAVLGVLIGGTYLLYRGMATDFLPAMDEGSIILDYWTPPGTSLSETDLMLRQAEQVILNTPGVATYSRRTGTQLGFFITEPNRGDYVIKLKPRGQRPGVEAIIEELRTRIAAVEPAIHTDFGQLLEDQIGDLTGGAPQPIDVKIFGDDPQLLQAKAKQAASILEGVPGVQDVFNGIVIAGPALEVNVDPLAAARYGLDTRSVQAAVDPALSGTVVDRMQVGEKMYGLRIFARDSTAPLTDLRIRGTGPAAALLPLGDVARITTGAPEAEIDRENLKTYIGVTARLGGRDLGSAMGTIRQRLGQNLPLGPSEQIRYGGLYQQQQQSFTGLLYVLLAGLVLVSVVVLWEFGDWRAPIVTSLCAIAVLAGVLAVLKLTGTTLNISSYVGAIMMVGIVGENAIFVIHEARLALLRGCTPHEAWREAAHRRLRPVLMTVLATAFALAPLALALGQGAQLMQPLAIAVIGGFVLSGPIVLLVLPGLYRLLDPRGRLVGSFVTD